MLPLKKAKIVLEYTIGGEVLSNWPGGLGGVGTDVKVVYGDEYVPSPYPSHLYLLVYLSDRNHVSKLSRHLFEGNKSCHVRLTSRLDLSLLKMAAEETIATVQEDGYVGIMLNVARDVAQQYA